jgi:DNA mismatch repair protein MSH3
MTSSPSKQATISTYFSQRSPHGGKKRASSPIDLTVDEPASPPVKRTRPSLTGPEIPESCGARAGSSRTASYSTSVAEQWRYTPSSPERIQEPRTAASDVERRKRHEAFKAKLLENNSIFVRKNSAKQNEADALEMEEGENIADKDLDSDSDGGFRSLTALFENKSKGKGKAVVRGHGNAAPSRGKKSAEVGPSGQPYTPLELQVRSFSVDGAAINWHFTGSAAEAG